MKLLLICADFPPVKSGEAGHMFYLALQLARRGVEVHVLTSAGKGVQGHPEFHVHPVMQRWSWLGLPRLAAFLKKCAPDAVLLHFLGSMYDHHPMMTFSPSISKKILPSSTFVTQFAHVGVHIWKNRPWSLLIRKLLAGWAGAGVDYEYGAFLRDSDKLIVLSEGHQSEFARHLPQVDSKSVLIPPPPTLALCPEANGEARKRGRRQLGVGEEEFLLVYYGFIYPSKGLETLLSALDVVRRNRPQVRLAILGDSVRQAASVGDAVVSERYHNMIQELPDRLGISDKVIWAGPCPPQGEEGSLYLRAADACVLPFDHGVHLNNSSFAGVVAHGQAIITTRGVSLESPFVHGGNVFLCPSKDPPAMAAAIEALMESPELCNRLRAGAAALAEEWFSWDRVIDRTLAALASRSKNNAAPAENALCAGHEVE